MSDKLKILFVAAEAVPFAKVGGLAEYSGTLPKAIRGLDVDIRVMVPRYNDGKHEALPKLKRVGGSIPVPVGARQEPAHLFETAVGDVPVYLIYNDQHFGNRERVYGFNDDPQRFVFFSRSVLAALKSLNWAPDLVHVNDWHTAPVVAWLDVYGRRDAQYRDIASMYTIHNFAYQGVSGRLLLSFGQMNDLPHLEEEPVGKVNWMAQGIAHSDIVTTVSPTYAQEMLKGRLGGDLQPLLQRRQDRFFGILSGIDTEAWNPASDSALTQTYDVQSLKMRTVNKTALQGELRLPVDMDVPLVGLVARLDPLKGIDLFAEALPGILASHDLQVVVLGTGLPELAGQLQALQAAYPRNFRALIRFDERMARRIYGSVDMFVLPSEHESVSVGLMTAMHYGAVPVAHAVGGLLDTVVDADEVPEEGTGFMFADYTPGALTATVNRALAAYDDEARWVTLQRRAMKRDCSWHTSAKAYVELYERALRLHRSR